MKKILLATIELISALAIIGIIFLFWIYLA